MSSLNDHDITLSVPFHMKSPGQMISLAFELLSSNKVKAAPSRMKRSCIGRKKYSCKLCHNIFFQSEGLLKHMKKHNAPTKCKYCSYTTFTNSCMNRHLVKHGIFKKIYRCRHCDLNFKSIVSRKQHEVSHTGVKCKICGKTFYSISKLRTHEQDHSELNVHPCHLCNKSYPHRFMLNSHIKVSHMKISKFGEVTYIKINECSEPEDNHSSLFTCQFCKKHFKHLNWLQLHEKKHVETQQSVSVEESNLFSWEKHFKTDCILCGIPISTMRHLRFHIKSQHYYAFGEEGFRNRGDCNFCGKYISPGPDNFIHAIGHLGFRPFKCHICSYRTHWIKSIKIHLGKNHSVDGTCYTCHKCQLTFRAFQLYKKHFQDEHNLEDIDTFHLCHICGKSFNSTSYFKRHIKKCQLKVKIKVPVKRESEIEIFSLRCELCSDIFDTRKELEDHYYVHENVNLHLCKYCSRKFLFKKHLNEHSNSHKENLKCQDCGNEFDSYMMKVKHRKLCAFDRLCTICDYVASHGQYLSLHMKSVHTDVCLQCDICCEIFVSPRYYFAHLQSHRPSGLLNDFEESYVDRRLYLPTIDDEEEDLLCMENAISSKNHSLSTDLFVFECNICGETAPTATQSLAHEANHKKVFSEKLVLNNCSNRMNLYKKSILRTIKTATLFAGKSSILSYSKKEFVLLSPKKVLKLPNPPINATTVVLPIPECLALCYSSSIRTNVFDAKLDTDANERVTSDEIFRLETDRDKSRCLKQDDLLSTKLVSITNIRHVDTIDTRNIPRNCNWIKLNSLPLKKSMLSLSEPLEVGNRETCDIVRTEKPPRNYMKVMKPLRRFPSKDAIIIDITDDDNDFRKLKMFPHQLQNNIVIYNDTQNRIVKEKIVMVNGIRRLISEDCGSV